MIYVLLFGHTGQTILNIIETEAFKCTCNPISPFKLIRSQEDLINPDGTPISREDVFMMIADFNEQYPEDIQCFNDAFAALTQDSPEHTHKPNAWKYPADIIHYHTYRERMNVTVTFPLAPYDIISDDLRNTLKKLSKEKNVDVSAIAIPQNLSAENSNLLVKELFCLFNKSDKTNIEWLDYLDVANNRYGRLYSAEAENAVETANAIVKSIDLKNIPAVLLLFYCPYHGTLREISEGACKIEEMLDENGIMVWSHRIHKKETVQILLIAFQDIDIIPKPNRYHRPEWPTEYSTQ